MRENCKISILIPVYNVEAYLEECLNSVLQQSINDYEIILVNDGSTDNSGKICDEYAAEHPDKIRVIHKSNEGLLLTRRRAFFESTGDWLLCVDSDDRLAPNALEVIHSSIMTNDCDMLVFDLLCVHIDGKEEIFAPKLTDGKIYTDSEKMELYNELLITYYLNSMCTKVIHRSILDVDSDYEQYSAITVGEDLFQSYPIFDNAKRVLYINRALYLYRKNSGSISMAVHPRLYDMRKILWLREDYYIQKWKIDNQVIRHCNTIRVKTMINYLVSCLNHFGVKRFCDSFAQIASEKFFSNAYSNCSVNLRYKIYGKLILLKRARLMCILIQFENILFAKRNRRKS